MKDHLLHICKIGSKLNQKELEVLNFWRIKEFNSSYIWKKDNKKELKKNIVFFIKGNNKEILAIARLKKIYLWVGEKKYNTLGLGSVVAIKKSCGYGSFVLEDIKNFYFNMKRKIPIIGFCNPGISEFYIKNSFKTIKNGGERFYYIDEKDNKNKGNSDDLIYFPEKDLGIIKVLIKTKNKIYHYIPRW